MPRTSVILVRKHGESEFSVLPGSGGLDYRSNSETIRALLAKGGVHDEFAEVQHRSDVPERTLRFKSPGEHESQVNRQAEDRKKHLAQLEAEKSPVKAALKPESESKPGKVKPGKVKEAATEKPPETKSGTNDWP